MINCIILFCPLRIESHFPEMLFVIQLFMCILTSIENIIEFIRELLSYLFKRSILYFPFIAVNNEEY